MERNCHDLGDEATPQSICKPSLASPYWIQRLPNNVKQSSAVGVVAHEVQDEIVHWTANKCKRYSEGKLDRVFHETQSDPFKLSSQLLRKWLLPNVNVDGAVDVNEIARVFAKRKGPRPAK